MAVATREDNRMKTEEKIVCNVCGKVISERGAIPTADYLHVEKEWGYFSRKDGQKQEFDLCESCYDAWIKTMRVPVTTREVTELV